MLSLRNVILKQNNAITRPMTIVALCCVALVYAASFSSGIYNEYIYNYEVHVASGPTGFKFKAKASLDILYASKAALADASDSNEIRGHAGGSPAAGLEGDSLLVRLRLSEPLFYPGPLDERGEPLAIEPKYSKLYNPDLHLYAHIVTLTNGTAIVREVFTHQADAITFKNIKKSILLNILPTSHHLKAAAAPGQQQQQQQPKERPKQGEELLEYISLKPLCFHQHDNSHEQPELFSPDSISHTNIVARARRPAAPESSAIASASNGRANLPLLFQLVDGQQNVTFRSRLFGQAESNLTTKFSLELVKQVKSSAHERFDQAQSVAGALELLENRSHYEPGSVQLERERRTCSSHHCDRSLEQLFKDYQDSLGEDSMASVEAAVAYLRILDRLRQSEGTGVKDILAILKRTRRQRGLQSAFLDILAAARTRSSIQAALKHLRLAKSTDLEVAERFLSVLSVAGQTAAKMRLGRPVQSPYYFTPGRAPRLGGPAAGQRAPLASLEFVAGELLAAFQQAARDKWALEKLRWSSLLTLATLVNARNQERDFHKQQQQQHQDDNHRDRDSDNGNDNDDDQLNASVERLLLDELAACAPDEADCRIVAMQAIGNAGRLGEQQFAALRKQVLAFGGRESNAAMRVLRDLLQAQARNQRLASGFYEKLEEFLLQIVYDKGREATGRLLAAEMIVRFVPNSLVSEELLERLPTFGNSELATMIYSRMQSLRPAAMGRHKHEHNWYWKSCVVNGTSTSFVKTMARTESLNASYGVNVELSDRGKMFKESSFDVLLDTNDRTQDLFSLGIFARGLGKMSGAGADDEPAGGEGGEGAGAAGAAAAAEDETTMAGMSLKLLGGYLRPYIFFSGYSELLGHLWSGAASEPTSAYSGNLLLIDHDEGYPLIGGFVAEQRMRAVLSIDVSGQVKVSLWYKNSHSTVTTRAAVIVQASQSVFTSYEKLWHSHLFSFGGQALVEFKADAHFRSMPVQTCLQVTQPEFSVRYNSRRHDQLMGDEIRRKLARRSFSIGAKSYSLNSENNKMCSLMIDEL